jgi:hypothetical protein
MEQLCGGSGRDIGNAAGIGPRSGEVTCAISIQSHTNQEAIRALFRVINRYVGDLPPMPGVFPDYPAPVVRNTGDERELHDALGHAATAAHGRAADHQHLAALASMQPEPSPKRALEARHTWE